MPHPTDGSIWYTVGVFGGAPGFLRFDPKTQLSEVYNVPMPASASAAATSTRTACCGARRRAATSSASIGASARARSTVRRRPAIIAPRAGRSTSIPGPGFDGLGENSAESSYYTWVDQHNTLGLGENVPMSTANLNDGFVALKDGKMVMLRIPYPMGFYAKGFDGRIDDPNAGWKGRGLWSTNGDRTPWLMEAAKARSRAPCTSSCGPIRSQISRK